jgi:hypothetical protein
MKHAICCLGGPVAETRYSGASLDQVLASSITAVDVEMAEAALKRASDRRRLIWRSRRLAASASLNGTASTASPSSYAAGLRLTMPNVRIAARR